MKLKTSLAVAFAVLGSLVLRSQTILTEDFTGYDGTAASIPNGWYFSWNSTSSPSFYSTSAYSGQSAPAYKFGVNNATIISPAFASADSLSFWLKASTTYSVYNTLEIHESPDSLNWTMLSALDTLPTTGRTLAFGLLPSTAYIKLVYIKVSGNLAIDDISIKKNVPLGTVEQKKNKCVPFYPNPSRGFINISPEIKFPAFIKISDTSGRLVEEKTINNSTFDCSFLKNGSYFFEIKDDKNNFSNLLIINK